MSLYLINCLLTLFLLFGIVRTLDYCKLCKRGTHTLCQYKEGPSDNCVEYKKPDISTSVKKYIVDIHNDIRNHVASGQESRGALGGQQAASNMNILQWDNELADIAQRWADQCIGLDGQFQHDTCRKTGRFEVGQNVLTALTPTAEFPEVAILILNWYKQVESVLPSDIDTFSGIQRGKFLIGQYTQLVWADTRFVGCGISVFRNQNTTDSTAKYLHRLVCNYGPRGNLIGSSVYKRGIPCSKCSYGKCDSIRSNLCKGQDEANSTYYYQPSHSKENSAYHINIPASLFNTLNLQYILKNNLTEVINNIIQKVNVYFAPSERDEEETKLDDQIDINKTIAALLSILPQANSNNIKMILQNPPTAVDRVLFRKMSNILNHKDGFDKLNIFDLENGHVIVDDCKSNLQQCQFEDEEPSTMHYYGRDIVLPNNMIYRKAKGIWFHGKCRCDYVYRSSASFFNPLLITIVSCLLINFQ